MLENFGIGYEEESMEQSCFFNEYVGDHFMNKSEEELIEEYTDLIYDDIYESILEGTNANLRFKLNILPKFKEDPEVSQFYDDLAKAADMAEAADGAKAWNIAQSLRITQRVINIYLGLLSLTSIPMNMVNPVITLAVYIYTQMIYVINTEYVQAKNMADTMIAQMKAQRKSVTDPKRLKSLDKAIAAMEKSKKKLQDKEAKQKSEMKKAKK